VKTQGKKTKAALTVLKKIVPTFSESFLSLAQHTPTHKRTEFTGAAVWWRASERERERERLCVWERAVLERDRAWKVEANP
jgi:hypothetical protein